ncbi:hypothetical protein [Haloarcula sp. Atlit-120R]|nr:hypothetical protein [Haloarcula sp. Atlit-120R]
MIQEIRKAWRLYQTDSREDTILAVVLVAVVAYPFAQAWVRLKRLGGEE